MPKPQPLSNIFIAWLSIAAVLGLVWLLASYPGNPTKRPVSDSCETIAPTQSQTNKDQYPPQNNMAAIIQRNTDITNDQRGTEKEHQDNERRLSKYTCELVVYTANLATFTKYLAGITFVVALIGVWQGWLLSQHGNHLSGSVEVARRSVNVAEDTLETSHRPWVGIDSVQGIRFNTQTLTSPIMTVKNFGNGPALNARFWIIGVVLPPGQTPEVPIEIPDNTAHTVIMPGAIYHVTPFMDNPISANDIELMLQKKSRDAWIVGRIIYFRRSRDAGDPYVTTIRLKLNERGDGWGPTEIGNNAT